MRIRQTQARRVDVYGKRATQKRMLPRRTRQGICAQKSPTRTKARSYDVKSGSHLSEVWLVVAGEARDDPSDGRCYFSRCERHRCNVVHALGKLRVVSVNDVLQKHMTAREQHSTRFPATLCCHGATNEKRSIDVRL